MKKIIVVFIIMFFVSVSAKTLNESLTERYKGWNYLQIFQEHQFPSFNIPGNIQYLIYEDFSTFLVFELVGGKCEKVILYQKPCEKIYKLCYE